MGTKRGRGRGSFIASMLASTDTCYAEVLQYLKVWSAAPPKLRQPEPQPPEAEPTRPQSLSSTEYSSQDGAEPAVAMPVPAQGDTADPTAAADHQPEPEAHVTAHQVEEHVAHATGG